MGWGLENTVPLELSIGCSRSLRTTNEKRRSLIIQWEHFQELFAKSMKTYFLLPSVRRSFAFVRCFLPKKNGEVISFSPRSFVEKTFVITNAKKLMQSKAKPLKMPSPLPLPPSKMFQMVRPLGYTQIWNARLKLEWLHTTLDIHNVHRTMTSKNSLHVWKLRISDYVQIMWFQEKWKFHHCTVSAKNAGKNAETTNKAEFGCGWRMQVMTAAHVQCNANGKDSVTHNQNEAFRM